MKEIRSVMIVEDDDALRSSLASFFESRGLQVHAFDNGTKAVEEAIRLAVDIAVVDVNLPGTDGIEIIRKLSTLKPEGVFVCITSEPTEELCREAVDAGAARVFSKPLNLTDMEDLLEKGGAPCDA